MDTCSRPGCTQVLFQTDLCAGHYSKRVKQGRARRVPRDVVAARLGLLVDVYGWTFPEIEAATGVHRRTWFAIRSGRCMSTRKNTAQGLFSIPLEHHGPVPSIGTCRRAQALAFIGYSFKTQSRMIGWTPESVASLMFRPTIPRSAHEKMVGFYNQYSMLPADDTGPVRRCRNRARNLGFAGPLAWDEDTIDDPDASPKFGSPNRVHRRRKKQ